MKVSELILNAEQAGLYIYSEMDTLAEIPILNYSHIKALDDQGNSLTYEITSPNHRYEIELKDGTIISVPKYTKDEGIYILEHDNNTTATVSKDEINSITGTIREYYTMRIIDDKEDIFIQQESRDSPEEIDIDKKKMCILYYTPEIKSHYQYNMSIKDNILVLNLVVNIKTTFPKDLILSGSRITLLPEARLRYVKESKSSREESYTSSVSMKTKRVSENKPPIKNTDVIQYSIDKLFNWKGGNQYNFPIFTRTLSLSEHPVYFHDIMRDNTFMGYYIDSGIETSLVSAPYECITIDSSVDYTDLRIIYSGHLKVKPGKPVYFYTSDSGRSMNINTTYIHNEEKGIYTTTTEIKSHVDYEAQIVLRRHSSEDLIDYELKSGSHILFSGKPPIDMEWNISIEPRDTNTIIGTWRFPPPPKKVDIVSRE